MRVSRGRRLILAVATALFPASALAHGGGGAHGGRSFAGHFVAPRSPAIVTSRGRVVFRTTVSPGRAVILPNGRVIFFRRVPGRNFACAPGTAGCSLPVAPSSVVPPIGPGTFAASPVPAAVPFQFWRDDGGTWLQGATAPPVSTVSVVPPVGPGTFPVTAASAPMRSPPVQVWHNDGGVWHQAEGTQAAQVWRMGADGVWRLQ
jgi:hypothetical protein